MQMLHTPHSRNDGALFLGVQSSPNDLGMGGQYPAACIPDRDEVCQISVGQVLVCEPLQCFPEIPKLWWESFRSTTLARLARTQSENHSGQNRAPHHHQASHLEPGLSLPQIWLEMQEEPNQGGRHYCGQGHLPFQIRLWQELGLVSSGGQQAMGD